ncbi:type II secretion system protein [bacterium]|nr:type II secretion system protein [bacterium]
MKRGFKKCNDRFTTHTKSAAFTLAEGPRRTGYSATNCGKTPQLMRSAGFTLAEVLITLGIIGVVAAMTIPTLIANTQGQRVRSQFKKTLSTLNQAGKMAQAQYDWDFGALSTGCNYSNGSNSLPTSEDLNPETKHSLCALLAGTLKGGSFSKGPRTSFFSSMKIKTSSYSGGSQTLYEYSLADGANLVYHGSMRGCLLPSGSVIGNNILSKEYKAAATGSQPSPEQAGLNQCIGYIDINGTSLPNKEVTCADGTAALDPQNPCVVSNKNIGDIIPVVFHDGVVEPATNAGKYLLNTAK